MKEEVIIEWEDSYGTITGWQGIEDFAPELLKVKSYGVIVHENKDTVSLAQNYAKETEYTQEQANGIMVIPRTCIRKITFLHDASCLKSVSEQKLQ